jgi:ParB family chromosome partitioning protein
MTNRETVYNTADRSNSKKHMDKKYMKEKAIRTSRTDIYERPFIELLPSEKAAIMKDLYDMNCDSEQCNLVQTEEIFGCYVGRCRSRKELAERFGYSSRNVARYLRINDLIQPLKDLVDGNKISLVAAVELSYLPVGEQWIVYNVISKKGLKLKQRVAGELRKHSGELTEEMVMDQFEPVIRMKDVSCEPLKVEITNCTVRKFLDGMDDTQKSRVVEKALEEWFHGDKRIG